MDFTLESTTVTPMVLGVLESHDFEAVRRRLCHDVNRPNTAAGTFRYSHLVGSLRRWIGERHVHGLETGEIPWRSLLYEYTQGYNVHDADDEAKLRDVASVARDIGGNAAKGKLFQALSVCRDSGLAIDGQGFFSSGHIQLASGTVRSNFKVRGSEADLPETGAGGYNQDQAQAELVLAMGVLSRNRVSGDQLVLSSPTRAEDCIVVVYDDAQFAAWTRLRDARTINEGGVAVPNPYSSLLVVQDVSESGSALGAAAETVDIYYAPVSGEFRPVLWVVDRDISQVEIDEKQKFASGLVQVGVMGKFSSNAAFWQCAVRLQSPFGG